MGYNVYCLQERRSILWDQTEKRNQSAEMNSLPSDNQQTVNAFLVKSHQSFGLLDNVPSLIEPKSIFYGFKISSDILKGQLFYQIHQNIQIYCFRRSQTNLRKRFVHSGKKSTSSPPMTIMTPRCLWWRRISTTCHPTPLTLPSPPQNVSATLAHSPWVKLWLNVKVCLFSSMIASKYFDHYILWRLKI